MAAAATIAAKTTHGATLNMYYGEDNNYANSANGIYIASTYDPTGAAGTNASGQPMYLGGAIGVPTTTATTPITVNIPKGDYLSIAIDAVLNGNANPRAGFKNGTFVQPSFLGISEITYGITSTDSTASLLTPVASPGDTAGTPDTTIGGVPLYNSTANVNQTSAGVGGYGNNGPGGGYNIHPTWGSLSAPGGVAPNEPGFSSSHNNGGVGLFASISGAAGTTNSANNAGAIQGLEQFAASNNVANYNNATAFFDGLVFQALKAGTVTLQGFATTSGTEYWVNTNSATTGASTYAVQAGPVLHDVPMLVVNIIGAGPSGHPVVNYAGAANASYGPSVGTLTVTGSNGSYSVAQITGINDTSGTTEAKTFTPSTDEEIWAYDVLVNGVQASPTQLALLVTAINAGDTSVPASAGVVATTLSPVPNPFGSSYNLFLDPSGFSDAFLGIDLTNSNDSNLVGYSFSKVAVVPEPMTLGLLAVGGIGLMTRRHRRKA